MAPRRASVPGPGPASTASIESTGQALAQVLTHPLMARMMQSMVSRMTADAIGPGSRGQAENSPGTVPGRPGSYSPVNTAGPRGAAARPGLPVHLHDRVAGGAVAPRRASMAGPGPASTASMESAARNALVQALANPLMVRRMQSIVSRGMAGANSPGGWPDLSRPPLNEPAVVQELHQWMSRSGVSRPVAAQVVSALVECRNHPDGVLQLNGVHLSDDPLPDLSVVVPQARDIDLTDCHLKAFPQSLLRLTGLTRLVLSENPITRLPEEICDMAALRELYLSNTHLTELPQCIGRSGLSILDVEGCRLSALPQTIGEMRQMEELSIGRNPDLAELPDSLANLPPCDIYVNLQEPFSPQDLRGLPAHEVFAYDLASYDPRKVLPLVVGVAKWWQAMPGAASGSLPGRGAQQSPWAEFAREDNAASFAVWQHRMHGIVSGDSEEVARGMNALLQRMEKRPEFRRECFSLGADAVGACDDRVAIGFSHMQSALLSSRAKTGELSSAKLMEASLQLFNREALRDFGVAIAEQTGDGDEELEVVLTLETRLHGSLPLPEGIPRMLYQQETLSSGEAIDEEVEHARQKAIDHMVDDALAHVRGLQQDPGPSGLKAFLAGQSNSEFSAWADHLRRLHPQDFNAVNEKAQAKYEAVASDLGGTPDAQAQAGVESKAFYNQEFADLVWRLTQASLPAAGAAGTRTGGAPPDGASSSSSSIPADRTEAFHPAAEAARARDRLQRQDEQSRRSPPHSPR